MTIMTRPFWRGRVWRVVRWVRDGHGELLDVSVEVLAH
jgi:hypothetical protein